MNETKNTKRMSEKSKFTLRYIIMTLVLSMILFACVIGFMFIFDGTRAGAVEKENKENSVQTENFEYIEPMAEPDIKTIEAHPAVLTYTSDNKEPEYINLGEFRLTAYCSCEQCCGEYGRNRPKDKNGNDIVYTAFGKVAQAGYTVAADPSVLPYGTIIYINGHKFEVQDCGGAVKGNRVDIYFDNHQDALEFGVQYADVFVETH
jgi:3D (Asp-Asp-Asp) domain-containing protein